MSRHPEEGEHLHSLKAEVQCKLWNLDKSV